MIIVTCLSRLVYLINCVVLFVYPQAFYPPDCTEHEMALLKVTEDSSKLLSLFPSIHYLGVYNCKVVAFLIYSK